MRPARKVDTGPSHPPCPFDKLRVRSLRMTASGVPTLDHPNDEDLSLGTPTPHGQERGEGGAPGRNTIHENALAGFSH